MDSLVGPLPISKCKPVFIILLSPLLSSSSSSSSSSFRSIHSLSCRPSFGPFSLSLPAFSTTTNITSLLFTPYHFSQLPHCYYSFLFGKWCNLHPRSKMASNATTNLKYFALVILKLSPVSPKHLQILSPALTVCPIRDNDPKHRYPKGHLNT